MERDSAISFDFDARFCEIEQFTSDSEADLLRVDRDCLHPAAGGDRPALSTGVRSTSNRRRLDAHRGICRPMRTLRLSECNVRLPDGFLCASRVHLNITLGHEPKPARDEAEHGC
jgi:hypothetical protein